MVIGYERTGNRVAFRCPDTQCSFASGLPIYVVDEDIYEFKPSMVIGTVDKFAQLAWRYCARALFGVAADGTRQNPPPNLIIRDELHLIAGPLGSMVGLYETLVEELCCDGTGDGRIRPKIISSTATIRRYREQIRALYAREHAALFPPPGLDAADSFFARYGRDADGRLERGRIYTGVHAPGLGSIQTAQVRSISALLQVPVRFDAAERDPWWTLMLFFNSLRELGTTVSLLQSDIPDYLKVLRNRYGLGQGLVRWIDNILELTGRLPSQQVRKAIDQLEVTTEGKGRAIDVCLASSILEVGIDIDRLSLMVVVGQPKTTSQYIQVTGRVGRRTQERPGLIVTIYGASKPRDRSHFEKFRSYHERLYAQVEPTSVTPFSPPALDRALHALMAAFVRQTGSEQAAASPYPYPGDMLEALRELVLQRALVAAPEEQATIEAVFAKRAGQWERWERTHWDDRQSGDDTPLLRTAGAYVTRADERVSWATPISLRNVDAEAGQSRGSTSKRKGTRMAKYALRRAQLIAPFGTGALQVVSDGTSVITAGLDHWYEREEGAGDVDAAEFRLDEWRLQERLGVDHFLQPPDSRSRRRGQDVPNTGLTVPLLRFPQWHFCPRCRRLWRLPLTARGRQRCQACLQAGKKVYLAQVPFVAMCEQGHLQDFPWHEWVHRSAKPECPGALYLYATGGASLSAQRVECKLCGKERNLGQITTAYANGTTYLSLSLDSSGTEYLCQGGGPWLGTEEGEPCDSHLRGSLRSASNLYFADVQSAIYLPRQ